MCGGVLAKPTPNRKGTSPLGSWKQTLCPGLACTMQAEGGPGSPSPTPVTSQAWLDTGEPSGCPGPTGQAIFKSPGHTAAPSFALWPMSCLKGLVVGEGCKGHPTALSCKGVATNQVLGIPHINLGFGTLVLNHKEP